jgi:hypothetical protein
MAAHYYKQQRLGDYQNWERIIAGQVVHRAAIQGGTSEGRHEAGARGLGRLAIRDADVLHRGTDGAMREALFHERKVHVAGDQVGRQGVFQDVRVSLVGRQPGSRSDRLERTEERGATARGRSVRWLAGKYGLTKSAIHRHMRHPDSAPENGLITVLSKATAGERACAATRIGQSPIVGSPANQAILGGDRRLVDFQPSYQGADQSTLPSFLKSTNAAAEVLRCSPLRAQLGTTPGN